MLRLSRPGRSLFGWAWSDQSAYNKFGLYTSRIFDPMIKRYMWAKFRNHWYADSTYYPYFFLTAAGAGIVMGVSARHFLFNPDVYVRFGEKRLSLPDRHFQHSYSLPYYNHHLRNYVARFRWSLIDNEPDYSGQAHPWGIRPTRTTSPTRMWLMSTCAYGKYHIDDPLFERNSHMGMNQMFEEMGYYPKVEAEDDD
eukprot:GDKH01005234.1.p1 GENE.GDKH01005234.1~~GDKH01005234.1.p1  ORF type:complete len:196 (-),score=17.63 GDKH01005234.1:300-887(-)